MSEARSSICDPGSRLSAHQLSARADASKRAREHLSDFVDEVLARHLAKPHQAARAHQLIENSAPSGTRSLVDGDAVVRITQSIETLVKLTDIPQTAWR